MFKKEKEFIIVKDPREVIRAETRPKVTFKQLGVEDRLYNGKTYYQWTESYNKGKATYREYLLANKILLHGIPEEDAIKEVNNADKSDK